MSDDDMRPEYDFSAGVRGKHHEQYKAGANVVFLDADVAKVFKDSESVNRALRLLLDLAKSQMPPDRAHDPGGCVPVFGLLRRCSPGRSTHPPVRACAVLLEKA